MASRGTPALVLLERGGVTHQVHAYQSGRAGHESGSGDRPDYGHEAAAALGVDPGRMFKTLIADVDGRLVAALVPVSGQLDPRRLASAVDGRLATLADPTAAERAAGSVVGAISPLAMRRLLPTVIDGSAIGHRTVFVSAGRRGLQVELDPADLVRLTGARVAAIARAARQA